MDIVAVANGQLMSGRTRALGPEGQAAPEYIANIEPTSHCRGTHIKASVGPDGNNYTVQIGADGKSRTFQVRGD